MIFDRVRDRIAEVFGIDEDDIAMESVIQELATDSLEIASLIMDLEEEFDIHIDDDDIESLSTVGDVVRYIKNNIEE